MKHEPFCQLYNILSVSSPIRTLGCCVNCSDKALCAQAVKRLFECRNVKELSELSKYLADSEPVIREAALKKYKELHKYSWWKKLFRKVKVCTRTKKE